MSAHVECCACDGHTDCLHVCGAIRCLDCGADYDAAMALSLLIPRAQWLAIHPDDGGVLCANCMLRRAAKLPGAINITGRVTFADEYVEGRPTPYDIASAGGASWRP